MRKKTLKTIIFITIGILFILILFYYNKIQPSQWNTEELQKKVEGFGLRGLLIFIGITGLRPFLFFPNGIIFIAGGLIYGTFLGSLAALAGISISFSLCYWLGNKFENLFKKIVGQRYLIKLKTLKNREIIKSLFIMRVIPGFPIDPISYGCSLVGISFKKFLVGSLLGIAPKVFLYSFLGDSINNLFSLKTLTVYGILFLIAIIPIVFTKKDFNIFH